VQLFLYYIGRARDKHANALAEEYIKRSSRYLSCAMREIDPRRFDLFARHATARKVLLDPAGQTMDTPAFVNLVRQAELDASDLVFLVGGHDGLPAEWRSRADLLLSLTPLTLPHELARAVLAEQVYRAVTTLRGHPYPR
jgi:23S rRNA (pseudouridine1915-N3)-methyltransferase